MVCIAHSRGVFSFGEIEPVGADDPRIWKSGAFKTRFFRLQSRHLCASSLRPGELTPDLRAAGGRKRRGWAIAGVRGDELAGKFFMARYRQGRWPIGSSMAAARFESHRVQTLTDLPMAATTRPAFPPGPGTRTLNCCAEKALGAPFSPTTASKNTLRAESVRRSMTGFKGRRGRYF